MILKLKITSMYDLIFNQMTKGGFLFVVRLSPPSYLTGLLTVDTENYFFFLYELGHFSKFFKNNEGLSPMAFKAERLKAPF